MDAPASKLTVVSAAILLDGVIHALPAPARHHHVIHKIHDAQLLSDERRALSDERRALAFIGFAAGVFLTVFISFLGTSGLSKHASSAVLGPSFGAFVWGLSSLWRKQDPMKGEQGFVLSDGQFARRDAAARIAVEAGQIAAPQWPPSLYSEDLW